jgi:hypothetical protein
VLPRAQARLKLQVVQVAQNLYHVQGRHSVLRGACATVLCFTHITHTVRIKGMKVCTVRDGCRRAGAMCIKTGAPNCGMPQHGIAVKQRYRKRIGHKTALCCSEGGMQLCQSTHEQPSGMSLSPDGAAHVGQATSMGPAFSEVRPGAAQNVQGRGTAGRGCTADGVGP